MLLSKPFNFDIKNWLILLKTNKIYIIKIIQKMVKNVQKMAAFVTKD